MSTVSTRERGPDLEATPGELPTTLACSGCGRRVDGPIRLTCPNARAGDDIDHILVRRLDSNRVAFPTGNEQNPFVRYRTLLHAYHAAVAGGWSDAEIISCIERMDARVARVDGHGFVTTPLVSSDRLAAELDLSDGGAVLVKDETANVAGSHKARHLFGTLLELELAGSEAVGVGHPLAIASCGNAALAAAVVARAAERRLRVFIPDDADAWIAARLADLGAEVETCARVGGASGDPTYHRLLEAITAGAVPFTCQGNLNGLAIEGGETLGWELVSQLATTGAHLDRLVIQVGGGALASAVIQAFFEAQRMGVLRSLPRIHAVQTRGAFPLARAHERAVARLGAAPTADAIEALMADAAIHRSEFMWPWETAPNSVAEGILDDETYDWRAVVRGMLLTGGSPLIVDEATLRQANQLAVAATGIAVSHTGSAGLAGLLDLRRRGQLAPNESVGVIFTGIQRSGEAP